MVPQRLSPALIACSGAIISTPSYGENHKQMAQRVPYQYRKPRAIRGKPVGAESGI